MAVLAPIPSARVSTATAVKPGFFSSWRKANLRSFMSCYLVSIAREWLGCYSLRKLTRAAQSWIAGAEVGWETAPNIFVPEAAHQTGTAWAPSARDRHIVLISILR